MKRLFLGAMAALLISLPAEAAEYRKVIPGKSTYDEVTAQLGSPILKLDGDQFGSVYSFQDLSSRDGRTYVEIGADGVVKLVWVYPTKMQMREIVKVYKLDKKKPTERRLSHDQMVQEYDGGEITVVSMPRSEETIWAVAFRPPQEK